MRWAPDPRFCFRCDRDLQGDQTGGLTYCDECRSVADAINVASSGQEPPTYRGTVALSAPLDGWPTDLTLLALDVWDRYIELRTAETPRQGLSLPPRAMGGAPLGDRPPHQWVVTTDVGTTHHGMAGGGGTPGTDKLLEGTHTLVPSLPADARRIEITAAAPGASATITAELDRWPAEIRSATVEISTTAGTGNADCPSCGPPAPPPPPPAEANDTTSLSLDWAMDEPPPPRQDACHVEDKRQLCGACRSVAHEVLAAKKPRTTRPHRVIATSADLGDLFGSHLHVPSIETWTTWFDLTLVGDHQGPFFELFRSARRARCWSAHDDRDGSYQGVQVAGRSNPSLVGILLTFTPALDPEARALTLLFPASFGGTVARATIGLPT